MKGINTDTRVIFTDMNTNKTIRDFINRNQASMEITLFLKENNYMITFFYISKERNLVEIGVLPMDYVSHETSSTPKKKEGK